jgi:diguanylate cyclase (GGDEF)-like protein/PAS domain S-box-containing protein
MRSLLARFDWLWSKDERVLVLDLLHVVNAFFMVFTDQTVLLFHLVFVMLGFQAFFLRFKGFAIRASFWITFATLIVLRAVHEGRTQPDEMIEIPLLTMIIVSTFVIAGRREHIRSQLARTNEFLNGTLAGTEDGIMACDGTERLVLVNPAARRLLGVHGEKFGWSDITLTRPGDDQAVPSSELPLRRAYRGETVREEEYRADGGKRVLLVSSLPMGERAGALMVMHDVTARKGLEDELAHRALHDPLTELGNRALFKDRVAQAVARHQREDRPFAVMLLDLDDFKTVNDSLGHAAGDDLLVALSARLKDRLRGSDTLARLGGDEFGVLLEGLRDGREAATLAARLLEALDRPFSIRGHDLVAHGSIGIAMGRDDGVDALIRDADVAMYLAKSRGKARYEFFEQGMQDLVVRRLEFRSELQRALDSDQFELDYQPILELESGRAVGIEALIRWQHPTDGRLAPDRFIGIAEESGLIVPIGAWVLTKATTDAAELSRRIGPIDLSVNLSARQLRDPALLAHVRRALDASGLDPQRLILEITEHVLVEESERLTATLKDLRALGVRIAIDDFGRGYSSLSYLRRFPVDILKIDRAFVAQIGDHVNGSAEAEAIVALAKAFDIEVVAEGIEEENEWTALRAMGCQLGQGFLFARPQEINQLAALLERGLLREPLSSTA